MDKPKMGAFEPESGMFDASGLDKPLTPTTPSTSIDSMSVPELIELRQRIEARLPVRRLADIDLEQEIVLQYQASQALMTNTSNDAGTPANQKAQVANSCASVLDQLMKMQTRIYNAERIKAIEQSIIKVVKTLPEAAQMQFFTDYERIHLGAET